MVVGNTYGHWQQNDQHRGSHENLEHGRFLRLEHFSEKWTPNSSLPEIGTQCRPSRLKADLGGFPQKMRPTKESIARFRFNLIETRSSCCYFRPASVTDKHDQPAVIPRLP